MYQKNVNNGKVTFGMSVLCPADIGFSCCTIFNNVYRISRKSRWFTHQ